MNTYPLNIDIEPDPSSLGLAVAAINDTGVIELRRIEEVLGDDYHAIMDGTSSLTDEVLDALCFHDKTKIACLDLSFTGSVCFGVLSGDVFIELYYAAHLGFQVRVFCGLTIKPKHRILLSLNDISFFKISR